MKLYYLVVPFFLVAMFSPSSQAEPINDSSIVSSPVKNLCTYQQEKDEYVCNEEKLPTKIGEISVTKDEVPPELSLELDWYGNVYRGKKPFICPAFANVTIGHKTQGVTIHWDKVYLIVNGSAKSVLPGYTKKNVSSLTQRPSSAPSGASVSEFFVLSDLEDGEKWSCPYTDLIEATSKGTDTIELRLPVQLENGDTVNYKETINFHVRPIAESERATIIAYSINNTKPPIPGYPPKDIGFQKYYPWTILGTTLPVALIAYLFYRPSNEDNRRRVEEENNGDVVGALAPGTLVISGCMGGLGFWGDYSTIKAYSNKLEKYESKAKKADAYKRLREKYGLSPENKPQAFNY